MVDQVCYVMTTDAFDLVIKTDFFLEHLEVKTMSMQPPKILQGDFRDITIKAHLELTPQRTTRMTTLDEEVTIKYFKTECYQLNPEALHDVIPRLGFEMADLNVELFGSEKQHLPPVYCERREEEHPHFLLAITRVELCQPLLR